MVDSKTKEFALVNAKTHLLLETGKRPSEFVTDNPNDIPSLGGENISNDGFLKFDNIRYVSREYADTVTKGILLEDDILINKDGANTGKMAFVEKPPFQKTLINEHLYIIRNTGEFDQKYLFYCLFDFKGQKQIKVKIVGSAQGGISGGFIKRLMIPKPNLPIQQKISSLISCVDKNIEATKQIISKAERLKKALMQNLLTGKMKADGTYRKESEFYIDEKYGKIPKGWKFRKLREFGKFNNGVNFSKEQVGKGTLFVNLDDIFANRRIDCSKLNRVAIDNIDSVKLNKNDLVFVRSSVKLEGIGLPAIFDGYNGDVIFCGFVIRYSYETKVLNPEYLINLLHWEYYRNKVISYGQILANTNISQRALRNLVIAVPNEPEEQKDIANKINNIYNFIENKETKIKILQKLKKSLMQNLLTGKIRVRI